MWGRGEVRTRKYDHRDGFNSGNSYMITMRPRLSFVALFAAILSIFPSCASTDLSKAVKPYRSGDFALAAEEISGISGASKTDGVWIQMEKGSILKAAGRVSESQKAFIDCQNKVDELLKAAGDGAIAVGGLAGAGAVLTDDRSCNYVGSLYETQLVCVNQAVNGLLASDLPRAQAAVSQLRSRVDEATTVKAKTREYLEKTREANEKEREKKTAMYGDSVKKFEDVKPADADTALRTAYSSWADTSVGIGLYMGEVVGRESGKRGEFAGYLARASSDAKAQSWNKAAYSALAQGIDSALKQLEGANPGTSTYVIVEAGLAPQRQLNTERMNAFKSRGLSVDLPGLGDPVYSGKATVVAGGSATETHVVTDVAILKRNEFDINYPDLEHRAVMGKVFKQAVQVAGGVMAMTSGSDSGQMAGLGLLLLGAIASAAQGADLRSWDCLPFQYRVAAIPTPANGIVEIQVDGMKCQVKVQPGVANIVLATSVGPNHCAAMSSPIRKAPTPSS